VSAFDIARAMALGADWCNAARGFMFALGCIQSQSCHTDTCPVGVATQDWTRQRALVVGDKWIRVKNFHAVPRSRRFAAETTARKQRRRYRLARYHSSASGCSIMLLRGPSCEFRIQSTSRSS
jgi:glutamate synthase domain-containing protein 2